MITQSPGTIFGRMCILWSDIRTWAYVLKIFDRNLIKIKKNLIVGCVDVQSLTALEGSGPAEIGDRFREEKSLEVHILFWG